MQFLILWSAPLGWQIEGKKIECMDLQFLEQETEIQLCWTDVGLRMLTHYNGWSKHLEGWCLLSCCSGKCPSDLCPESPNSAAIKLAGMWKNEMVQATVGTSVFPIITTTVAQWVFCNVCRQLAYSVTLWRRGAYFSTWHREIGYLIF